MSESWYAAVEALILYVLPMSLATIPLSRTYKQLRRNEISALVFTRRSRVYAGIAGWLGTVPIFLWLHSALALPNSLRSWLITLGIPVVMGMLGVLANPITLWRLDSDDSIERAANRQRLAEKEQKARERKKMRQDRSRTAPRSKRKSSAA